MTCFEDVSIQHTASDTNKLERTVSVVCRSILTFIPFFPFAVLIQNFIFLPTKAQQSALNLAQSNICAAAVIVWSYENQFFPLHPSASFHLRALAPISSPVSVFTRRLPLVPMQCLPRSLSLTRRHWLNLKQADLITGYDADGPLTSHAPTAVLGSTHARMPNTTTDTPQTSACFKGESGLISNFGHLPPFDIYGWCSMLFDLCATYLCQQTKKSFRARRHGSDGKDFERRKEKGRAPDKMDERRREMGRKNKNRGSDRERAPPSILWGRCGDEIRVPQGVEIKVSQNLK